MYILTEAEFNSKALPALRQVFVNEDAFDQPFSPNVDVRKIVYPCCQNIEPPLINALIDTASRLGDTGCYIFDLWSGENDTRHYYISFSEFYTAYLGIKNSDEVKPDELSKCQINMSLGLENILYSPNGKWGIMISHERHGMLGGSTEFIEGISQVIPNLDTQVYDFIEERLRNSETGKFSTVVLRWLPGLLRHVYGQATAEKILQEIGVKQIKGSDKYRSVKPDGRN